MRKTLYAILVTAVTAVPATGALAGVSASGSASACVTVSGSPAGGERCIEAHATTHGDQGDPDAEGTYEDDELTAFADLTPAIQLADTLAGAVMLRVCENTGGAVCADWEQIRDDLRSLND